MTQTDIKVLDDILSQTRQEIAPELSEDDFFEFFSAQYVLRDQQLDPDDIKSGNVGSDTSGSDGGIDSIYLLVNGRMIRDKESAENLKTLKQNVKIDVIIIQSSTHSGFTLDRLLRLKDTAEDIFSLDRDSFSEKYNDSLLDTIERFRIAHKALASKFPVLNVSYFYVTRGDKNVIAPEVQGAATEIENAATQILATITKCTFAFVGARALIELFTKPPKLVFKVKCVDAIPSVKGGYIALVKLADYYGFITDEKTHSELLLYLFESNVRDYQGDDVTANEAIQQTLKVPGIEEFWWLNNGVTVVAEKIGGHPKELVLEDPQIVNGLQTSEVLFNYFKSSPANLQTDARELLVRFIPFTDSAVHDKIIRATNTQTAIPQASLWATETIHRDIERMFKAVGLYYDRRKSSWRRKSIALAKVVGITELAQAVAAIFLQEPNIARGSPGRYFTKERYPDVFSPAFDVNLYTVCAQIRKRTEAFLKKREPDKRHRNNLQYYLMMTATCAHLRQPKANDATLADIDVSKFDDALFEKALDIVKPLYEKLINKDDAAADKVAKGPDLIKELKKLIRIKCRPKPKSKVKVKVAAIKE